MALAPIYKRKLKNNIQIYQGYFHKLLLALHELTYNIYNLEGV